MLLNLLLSLCLSFASCITLPVLTVYSSCAAAKKAKEDVPISAELDLDDLDYDETPEGAIFSHPCRCGDQFTVAEAEIPEDGDSIVVPCGSCSLYIKVLYTMAEQ